MTGVGKKSRSTLRKPGMRYFFTIKDHDREWSDPDGTLCRNEHQARACALAIISQLKESGLSDEERLVMIVSEEMGRKLFVIPFCTVHLSAPGLTLH
jgi:hypothetical protein